MVFGKLAPNWMVHKLVIGIIMASYMASYNTMNKHQNYSDFAAGKFMLLSI